MQELRVSLIVTRAPAQPRGMVGPGGHRERGIKVCLVAARLEPPRDEGGLCTPVNTGSSRACADWSADSLVA